MSRDGIRVRINRHPAPLEEVIVTATKREERLQDVPESITRDRLGRHPEARPVPNGGLCAPGSGSLRSATVSLAAPPSCSVASRPSGLQFGSVSSSSLYLDEQPITQSGRNPDPRLIDVDRVEALRGPQGTALRRELASPGTLRIITNKPDPTKLEAWFDAQLSNVNDGGMGYDRQRHDQRAAGRGSTRAAPGGLHRRTTPGSSTTC